MVNHYELFRRPELLLDLPRIIFLTFEEHMKKTSTFPSICITDNEENARQLNSKFDVVILVLDDETDLSDSLAEEIHQTTVPRFGETLHAVLEAYK